MDGEKLASGKGFAPGSLHFFLDEEGDLTVARFMQYDEGDGWQTIGCEVETLVGALQSAGWVYLAPVPSRFELMTRADVVDRVYQQVLPEHLRNWREKSK